MIGSWTDGKERKSVKSCNGISFLRGDPWEKKENHLKPVNLD